MVVKGWLYVVEEDLAFGLLDEVACLIAGLEEYLRRVSVMDMMYPRQEGRSAATA